MTNKPQSTFLLILKKYFPFFFFALLVYMPTFLLEFGFHNDYSMLLPDKRGWLDFVEAHYMLMLGRAMGAILTSVHCWMLTHVSDFAVSRFFAFSFVLFSLGLFAYYLQKRCQLGAFWSAIIVFGIFMLPSNQINILWVAHFFLGSFTLFLSIISYLLIDYARKENILIAKNKLRGISCILAAFFIFVFSLFIYSSTSLYVFVFTASLILFSPLRKWQDTRRIVLRDMIFFGSCLLFYRVLDRAVIIPWAIKNGSFPESPGGLLSPEITTDVLSKIPLIIETFLFSLSGIWYLLIGSYGGWIWIGIVAICSLLMIPSLKINFIKKLSAWKESKTSWASFLQGVFAFIILFFLANAPALLAQGCLTVVGFRVLLPGSAMLLILQIALMRKFYQSLQSKDAARFIKFITAGLALCWGFIAFGNVLMATLNCKYELKFIRSQVALKDHPDINRFIISSIPPGQSLIPKRSPLEFGMMTTSQTHVKPIIDEVLKKKNIPLKAVSHIKANDTLFLGEHSAFIDLNDIREKRINQPARRKIRLRTSAKNIFVHAAGSLNRSNIGPFLVFEQDTGKQRLPFWQIFPTHNQSRPWFEIDFENTPSRIRGYKVINTGRNNKNWNDTLLSWTLRGSMDGKRWVDLDQRDNTSRKDSVWKRLYIVKKYGLYNKYRFYFRTTTPTGISKILAVAVIFED